MRRILVVVTLGACSVSDEAPRVAVPEANALGITSLQIERTVEGANHIYTLHALSADDQEVALVRLTTGQIADITAWLPGSDNIGAELYASAGAHETRTFTREMQAFQFGFAGRDQEIVDFLGLPTVAQALEQANIHFESPPAETAYICDPNTLLCTTQWVGTCSASDLLNTQTVYQCCKSYDNDGRYETYFVNGNQATVHRVRNPSGSGCKSQSNSWCLGEDCYFGPYAFSKPDITPPSSSYPYGRTVKAGSSTPGYYCYSVHQATPVTSSPFGSVLGSQPKKGCPTGLSFDSSGDAWMY